MREINVSSREVMVENEGGTWWFSSAVLVGGSRQWPPARQPALAGK